MKVNRSTKEKTLVCRGDAEESVADGGGVGFDVEEVREDEEDSSWAMTVREDEVEDGFN